MSNRGGSFPGQGFSPFSSRSSEIENGISCTLNTINCSCLICSGIAENDKVVAVEDFIDADNILEKSLVALSHEGHKFKKEKS